MSQYNKTVLTRAGLELAKRANAGQAKFGITRAVASADDWSHKTVQDLEEVTTIPNIMQQGTIVDTDEVESNNSVIGVSLCFTNKNLSTGYQIRIIGLYVKEEGQENDFLYAVTTAISPEYMPSFADKVLYRFNMQMYLVIGNAQSVNVVINDGTAVTHGQLDKYKAEVTGNLKKLENTHKEDMSHVAKSASVNGGAEILPDSTGKLNLVVPDPDLSKYVSLEQLGELLKAKADVADVNKQIKAVTDLANTKANTVDVDAKIKTVTDLANTKASQDSLNKLSQAVDTKADKSDTYTKAEVDSKVTDAKNTAQASTDHLNIVKADKSNTYTKAEVDSRVNEAKSTAQSSDNQIWGAVNQIMPYKNCPELPDGFDLNSRFTGWRRSPNKSLKNMPSGWTTDSMYFQGAIDNDDGIFELALNIGFNSSDCPRLAYRIYAWGKWKPWKTIANDEDIASLQTQINTKHNIATPLFREIQNSNSWQDIFGVGNPNSVLTSIRIDAGGSGPLLNDFAAGVGFGGADTKGVLSVGYHNNQARITGGNGNGPVWSEDIAWKSDVNNLQNQVNDLINQINSPTIQDLYNKLAQYTVDYNNNYVHDTTIDFNSYLHETRTIKVANVKANNGPLANTATIWGWLTTYHWDDNSVTQEYRDAGGEVFWRATNASASRQWTWHKYAKQEDIDNQQRQINDLINNINYIKDNYVEGRRFPASQEAQAEAWENEKPTRLAMIEK